jgi:lysophospholipase L1-like esterase
MPPSVLSAVRARRPERPTFRPTLEALEDRLPPGDLWQLAPLLPPDLTPAGPAGTGAAPAVTAPPSPGQPPPGPDTPAAPSGQPTAPDQPTPPAVAAGPDQGPAPTALLVGIALAGADATPVAAPADGPVVFFGDSITRLGGAPGGFVTLVGDGLRAASPGVQVVNAGEPGDAVPDLQRRLGQDVLALRPSAVVVEVGVNDVWRFQTLGPGAGTPADQYEAGLRDVLGRIQAAGARVVLCTPTVIGEEADAPSAALLDQYAAVSRSVAADMGVTVADLHQAFQDYLRANNPTGQAAGVLTADGVHLSAAGNRLAADVVFGALRP